MGIQLRNALEPEKKPRELNRIFYMALPPSAFVPAASSIRKAARGYNRLIAEKPFGRDSASSADLGRAVSFMWDESSLYRIDHYLGKEMVQNLMVLRFANKFEPAFRFAIQGRFCSVLSDRERIRVDRLQEFVKLSVIEERDARLAKKE